MTKAGPLEVEPVIPTDVIIFVKSIFRQSGTLIRNSSLSSKIDVIG